jgi:hypothetical protein
MWPFKKKGTLTATLTNVQKQGFTNNMWVMTPQGIGIVTKLDQVSIVHLTDAIGQTVKQEGFPIATIRQARYTEIPLARRGDSEAARKLGYV